ncbi:unnamed protein product [Heterosigma akashiwo]
MDIPFPCECEAENCGKVIRGLKFSISNVDFINSNSFTLLSEPMKSIVRKAFAGLQH